MNDQKRPITVDETVTPTDDYLRMMASFERSEGGTNDGHRPSTPPTFGVVLAVTAEKPMRTLRVLWTNAAESEIAADFVRRL